jgi:hypothetical protein
MPALQHAHGPIRILFKGQFANICEQCHVHAEGTLLQGHRKPHVCLSGYMTRYHICSVDALTIPRESRGGTLGSGKASVQIPCWYAWDSANLQGRET